MQTYETPQQIELFRIPQSQRRTKNGDLGMKRRGQSAYSIIKQEFGLKGNKQSVLEQIEKLIGGNQ